MLSWELGIPLVFRTCTVLLLPHTFFQPDEFYQAFEPAHHIIFGYGYLTWEWQDIPAAADHVWYDLVQHGRMRSWVWPGLFAAIYKLLQVLRVDHTFLITLCPRIIGVLVAAFTDYYTSRLASKLLGPGASAPALFLSLTSLFNAHLLPRALSTSPETLLTTMALYYLPLDVQASPRLPPPPRPQQSEESPDDLTTGHAGTQEKLDYMQMDKDEASRTPLQKDRLALSIGLAALALSIRPTTVVFWAVLGVYIVWQHFVNLGASSAAQVIRTACLSGTAVIVAAAALDFAITGRVYLSSLTFVYINVFRNISAYYGATNKLFHLTQSLPILLFPIWWWSGKGFMSCLLPGSGQTPAVGLSDRPSGMRILSQATLVSLAALSLSPHSEWRFLHPWLPLFLIFAIPPLTQKYTPSPVGCHRFGVSLRQYTRIPSRPFHLLIFAGIMPYIYLNMFHGGAQVGVMEALKGEGHQLTGLVALMPCHSTPWSSHLHRDVRGWFLTCEPPLGSTPEAHRTQQAIFYDAPVTYLREVFPYPPALLHDIPKVTVGPELPSHVMLFGELLGREEGGVTVADALDHLGYAQMWYGWNGFDLLQDEALRRGGVRIWKRKQGESAT